MNKQEVKEWILDNKGKFLALILSAFYIIASLLVGEWIRMSLFLILPLACIFWGEAMGGYTGMTGLVRPPITKTTPGCFVTFAGWLLLLYPLVAAIMRTIFK